MRTYSVAEVSNILDVNAETIRRWIRDGKLRARRAMGPGGNTIFLADIIAFANTPPRTYLRPLEDWLEANGIAYQKIHDSHGTELADKASVSKNDPTSAKVDPLTSAAVALAAVSPLIPFVGPMVAATAATTAIAKRKTYHPYSIQLIDFNEKGTESGELPPSKEAPVEASIEEIDITSEVDAVQESREQEHGFLLHQEKAVPQIEVSDPAISVADILDQITQAKKMLDAGIITQEEFSEIKTRLIAKI